MLCFFSRPAARALHASALIIRSIGGTSGQPSVGERAREAFDISKEHAKAAIKNQAQAAEDVASGRASASNVYSEHAKEAKEDVKQWGSELRQAARGDQLPGEAQVRDLPPVQDRVRQTPTKAGATNTGKTSRR